MKKTAERYWHVPVLLESLLLPPPEFQCDISVPDGVWGGKPAPRPFPGGLACGLSSFLGHSTETRAGDEAIIELHHPRWFPRLDDHPNRTKPQKRIINSQLISITCTGRTTQDSGVSERGRWRKGWAPRQSRTNFLKLSARGSPHSACPAELQPTPLCPCRDRANLVFRG